MTKPGNSGSDEPTQAEAPEATSAETTSADTDSSAPAETPTPHESPIGAAGGPPDSTLPEGTDSSGSEAAEAEDTEVPDAAEAEPAKADDTEAPDVEAKPAKAKPAEKRRARVDLEKAPPVSKDEALRAQAKRRFEEPPPRMLRFSFYFFLGAGILWVITGVLLLVNKQGYIDALIADKNNKLSPQQTATSVGQLLWFYIIIAVVFAAFIGLFAYKATQGTRRARALVTIFAAILVFFHLILFRSQPGLLIAMFALVGLFLLWSRSARSYFPPRNVP